MSCGELNIDKSGFLINNKEWCQCAIAWRVYQAILFSETTH